ncbi:unnamed protein product [Prorocentrum cordatum]|uniref:Uncharacterized protein n=1 Tax=Prorocentrum cordatum TaxID=2364126 RepID=A0ABN9UI40_9DINO|nr:unnamed protein product [Polarella glacialis]
MASMAGAGPGMDHDYRLDFVVVGDSSVGKTCLLFRFTNDLFSTDHGSTIGVDFGSRIIDIGDARVKVHIWDTAGQESYRSITKSYFRNACAALLVYDVSVRNTFDHVAEWLEAVIAGASSHNIEIELIGNKSDKDHREVSYEEGAAFAEERQLVFWETSAKTGHNVKSAFEEAVHRVVNNIRNNKYDL